LEWFLIVGALFIGYLLGRHGSGSPEAAPPDTEDAAQSGKTDSEPTPADTNDLSALARALEAPVEQAAHPDALLELPAFERGVDLLCDEQRSTADVLAAVKGENWIISCMAAQALCRRKSDDDLSAGLLAYIRYLGAWPLYYVLKYLDTRNPESLIGPVLLHSQQWWPESRPMVSVMAEFIGARLARGEQPTFADGLDRCADEAIASIRAFLDLLDMEGLAPLRQEIARWQTSHVNLGTLRAIGRIWGGGRETSIVEHAALAGHVDRLASRFDEPPCGSLLLVGDTGVGKTSVVEVLAGRLQRRGWTIFEAGATDLLAGQVYIGELEGRVKHLLDAIDASRRVLWYAPDFHEFLYAGSHRYDPNGLLDRILPAIESRRIVVLGETTPQAYRHLLQKRERLRNLMEAVRIPALSDSDTLLVANEWAKQKAAEGKAGAPAPGAIAEAFNLVKQYLSDKGAPGSLLGILKATYERVAAEGRAAGSISSGDCLATLSERTGLPASILDDRKDLDVEALRTRFQRRVVGQAEAVNCIVDRVALLKAGLNDPSRPLGVFLFVGPTGTGKTEIAKTLAKFLFGAEDRMVRLDMSELQTPDAMGRILGEPGTENAGSLVDSLRRQPFSVVLLDEFEKAHPRIWDLFLQVFDDGRLTDRLGNTGDFRHSIIILTSNLGARISGGTNIGFTLGGVSFSRSAVEREVKNAFRPEFINRIDRVVVFHPLSRDVMRRILRRQLDDVLSRRGFRKRDWAVEWDESAVDFLLEKGFTPDLGARPLKRAVERYLLAPLSITIVQHDFPEGDQFLFISSDGKELTARFVDPDAPGDETPEPREAEAEAQPLPSDIHLKSIALDARGSAQELAFLGEELARLEGCTSREQWRTLKQASLAQTGAPGFWDSHDRVEVLSRIEVMDRIENGLRAASSLMTRVAGGRQRPHSGYLPDLLRRLAEQIYLLDTACSDFEVRRPHDAFILIDAQPLAQSPVEPAVDFFKKVNEMYLGWAAKRRMRYKQLKMEIDTAGHCHGVIAVTGFGAFSILEPEAGLHLLEVPKDERTFERCKVQVRVVPQPQELPLDDKELLWQAEKAGVPAEESAPRVVRRYREEPSPLVRDGVRQWRTGRLDRVFAGDFDLIC
jgi:ATP-dependent Clp protease ATP-binding subunit ClpC